MVYISYNNLEESEFDNILSSKNRVKDDKKFEIKLKVNDAFNEDGTKTTKFEASIPEDVRKETFLDNNSLKIKGQTSYIKKYYSEF